MQIHGYLLGEQYREEQPCFI